MISSPAVPHRDDHEAARHRIDALERELAETRARAERAERSARESSEKTPSPERSSPSEPASPPDPRWPARWKQRYLRAMIITTVVFDLPVLVVFAGWRWDLNDHDRWMVPWSFAPFGALILMTGLIAWICRAPHPGNAAVSGMLAQGLGGFTVIAATTDLVWLGVLAEPPARWFTRGLTGLVAIAAHAFISAYWTAEGAVSDPAAGSD
jgi:hypothetical protein